MATSAEAILQQVEEQQIEFISLQFTDIVGMLKNVTIPAGRLGDCLDHGVWFDGSSIEGLSRTRIAESDMFLVPDLTTFGVIPWDQDTNITTARLICDVYTPDGKPFAGDPRSVLKRVIDEATQLGYTLNVSPEVEFFLFRLDDHDRPILIPHDVAGYFDTSTDLATSIRRRMVRALQKFGIDVEATHHEVEIGQHEIDLRYGPALRLADSIITFRTTLKAIAQQHRLYATFMPKPLDGINGSGMHLHLSLADIRTEKNLFYATDDPYELSPLARHFTAGLLEHAKGMTAILAPLVNSYKRLMPGYEAPVYLSWGRTARSALVRIPRISPARPQTARVELRCPDPSCNPYLALAVVLKAGLDGVKRKLPPPEPVEEDLYLVDPRAYQLDKLPSSLGEALDELQQDDVIAAALGPHILERFVEAKTQEWNEYRTNVTQWELDRYLPTY